MTDFCRTLGLKIFSVAENSYEQNSNTTSPTVPIIMSNHPMTISERTPHLRIRSESLSSSSSAPSSPNATSPMSSSPNTFASLFMPTLFSGSTNTTTNTIQGTVLEDTVPPLHFRRSSQSDASGDQQHLRYIPARRYTLPNLNMENFTSNEKSQQTSGFRVPSARFWEAGGKEDSSVQVAMEHVQFGL